MTFSVLPSAASCHWLSCSEYSTRHPENAAVIQFEAIEGQGVLPLSMVTPLLKVITESSGACRHRRYHRAGLLSSSPLSSAGHIVTPLSSGGVTRHRRYRRAGLHRQCRYHQAGLHRHRRYRQAGLHRHRRYRRAATSSSPLSSGGVTSSSPLSSAGLHRRSPLSSVSHRHRRYHRVGSLSSPPSSGGDVAAIVGRGNARRHYRRRYKNDCESPPPLFSTPQ